MTLSANHATNWPALPLAEWKDTFATLHLWTQIAGKVRLAMGAPINHCWGSALYVSSRGLTTSAIPYKNGSFEIVFDFVAQALEIITSWGERRSFRLAPRTVAEFYAEVMAALIPGNRGEDLDHAGRGVAAGAIYAGPGTRDL